MVYLMDRDIKAVIQRLKDLEKPYYRKKYGIESQETSRRIATELFRGLLMEKEKKLDEINSKDYQDIEETEEIRMEKYKSKKFTEERKKARDLKNREE